MCVTLKEFFFCSNKVLDFLFLGEEKSTWINFSQNLIWKNKFDSYFFFPLNYIQIELNPNRKEKDNTANAIEDQMDEFGLRPDFSIQSKSMIPNWNPVAYHYELLKLRMKLTRVSFNPFPFIKHTFSTLLSWFFSIKRF